MNIYHLCNDHYPCEDDNPFINLQSDENSEQIETRSRLKILQIVSWLLTPENPDNYPQAETTDTDRIAGAIKAGFWICIGIAAALILANTFS